MRLTAIDASNIDVHVRLTPEDKCYFVYEYTSRKGYSFSATNGLIWNLKKKPSENWKQGYHYKGQAIMRAAAVLKQSVNPDWLTNTTLVPAPPSKAIGHPDYDSRIEKICKAIRPNLDVRCLVKQTTSMAASHEQATGARPGVQDLIDAYQIDEQLAQPAPVSIGIIDDVLTNGTHFKALQTMLSDRFPGVPITGIFIARRVFPDDENDFFDPV